jgi:O-antigen ligase
MVELEAHGLVFKLLSETGIAGLVLYCSFFLTVFSGVYKVYQEQKKADNKFNENLLYGCMAALVALFLLNSFFGTDTYTPRLWFPLAFISSHIYITRVRLAGANTK